MRKYKWSKKTLSIILVFACLLSSLSLVVLGASPADNDRLPPLTDFLLYQDPIRTYAQRTNSGPKNWICYNNGYLYLVNNCYFGIPADAGYFIPSSTPGNYVLYEGQARKDLYTFSWDGYKWKHEQTFLNYKYAISCQQYLQYQLPPDGFKSYTMKIHFKDSATMQDINHSKYCVDCAFRINGKVPYEIPEIPGFTLNKTQNIPGYDPVKKVLNLTFDKDKKVIDIMYTKN